jgi:outer membrane lipoprotein-sorting protein
MRAPTGHPLLQQPASRAQGSPTLQDLSVAQLLAKVAAASKTQTAISGAVTWNNGLVPGSDLSSLLSGQNSAPTSLGGLLLGGTGRVWLQRGSGLRLEAQGTDGDFVVIAGRGGLWTYSSATDTATHYDLPAGTSATRPAKPLAQATPVDPVAAIGAELQRFASIGTVAVSQGNVASRPSYLLTMRPRSTTTTVRAVQVAIDARTFVPLRLQVLVRGDSSAVLSAGFTSVSYGHIAGGLFDFTPPKGATVHQQVLPSVDSLFDGALTATTKARRALTLMQVESKAQAQGLALALPVQKALPKSLAFAGASVLRSSKARGVTVVLSYGSGFGSLVLVETSGRFAQYSALQQQVAHLPRALVDTVTVNGQPGYQLDTPLVTVATWRQGTTDILAVGAVPENLMSVVLATMQ